MTGYIIEVDLGDGTQRWVHPSGLLTRQRAEALRLMRGAGLSSLVRRLDPKTPRRLVPAQRPPAGTPESPWQLGGPVAGAGGGGT